AWPWALGGIVAGGTIIGLVERWRGRPFGLGDVEAVMPRTPRELGWGVILSLTAGVMEEGYFRLLLPLLATLATGSAVVGFGLATLLFGAAHRYQGWKGMIATAVTGALLAAVYLASGALWVAIALHVAIDLNALVARPVVSGRVRFGDTA
ncbi:CPBP family intramembrane glutamic endopeptidase, partial [Sphingomonas sp.]|uniref:CPBP family intramembrane glutamic endopeptidase n=1 Tax=Sphingomonas sp. TaxID=28214 RepID=UPI0035C78BE5